MKRLPRQINKMNTQEQLNEASEWERYDTRELIERCKEIATSQEQVDNFIALCNSYEVETFYAGSWSKSPSTIR